MNEPLHSTHILSFVSAHNEIRWSEMNMSIIAILLLQMKKNSSHWLTLNLGEILQWPDHGGRVEALPNGGSEEQFKWNIILILMMEE